MGEKKLHSYSAHCAPGEILKGWFQVHVSQRGKIFLFYRSRLFGSTELNVLWHDPGDFPGWGTEGEIKLNSGLQCCEEREMSSYWWLTSLISPAGLQQCCLCHHAGQLGWGLCSSGLCVNAALCPAMLRSAAALSGSRIGCPHCSLNCPEAEELWLPCWISCLPCMNWLHELPCRSQGCPVKLSGRVRKLRVPNILWD